MARTHEYFVDHMITFIHQSLEWPGYDFAVSVWLWLPLDYGQNNNLPKSKYKHLTKVAADRQLLEGSFLNAAKEKKGNHWTDDNDMNIQITSQQTCYANEFTKFTESNFSDVLQIYSAEGFKHTLEFQDVSTCISIRNSCVGVTVYCLRLLRVQCITIL